MAFRLGLAQCAYPEDGDVLAMVGRFVRRAKAQGCALVAFPEDLMSPAPLPAAELGRLAEPLDGPFVSAIAQMACDEGIWVAITM